jgi:hypothetical protein
VKTITMPYDEYIAEKMEIENELEEMRRKHGAFTKTLKPVFDIEYNKQESCWIPTSDWTKKQSLNSFVRYVGDTITDTIGWS